MTRPAAIRCDVGKIKVICCDTHETFGYLAAVARRPIDDNGQPVRCWTHVQFAQTDRGLKQARD